MNERYIRNLGALSESECALLRGKKVFVAGCGGLGGYIIDMLLRIGVGAITAADGDCFEVSNLNRQLFSNMNALGRSKAAAAAEYALRVNSEVSFSALPVFITEENARELIRGADVVLDALDSISARKTLTAACDREKIPYIYGAVSGWMAQAALSMPGDGLLDRLYPDDGIVADKGVLSFTPAVCAAIQCSLCVRLLCGRPVTAGTLYIMDMETPELGEISPG